MSKGIEKLLNPTAEQYRRGLTDAMLQFNPVLNVETIEAIDILVKPIAANEHDTKSVDNVKDVI